MKIFTHVSHQERVDFASSLALMLKSGVAINEALVSMEQQTRSHSFRAVIARIRERVESGVSFSAAVEAEQGVFDGVFISMVKSGEISGTLVENLRFLTGWLEREHELRQDIQAATLYPKIVLVAAALVGGLLTIVLLPKLIPFFERLQVDLPFATRMLLLMSHAIQTYWLYALIGAVLAGAAGVMLMRIRSVRRGVHRLILHTPIIGSISRNYQLAILTQLLSTLVRSGVPISETVAITSRSSPNFVYQDSMEAIGLRIEKGTPLAEALREFPHLYPGRVITLVSTGEKSGTLDIVLEDLAAYYTREVRIITKRLPTILEPVLLLFIAVVVGFIAISIILPIYQFTRGLQL
jgi:type IV pilus assembly protein PilC